MTSKFPHGIKELLAYQTLITHEARRCGGRRHFRQQVVGNESVDWSCLNQSLYAATFITQVDQDKSKSCVVCLESDHTEDQSALYSPLTKSPVLHRRAVTDCGQRESRDVHPSS